MQVTVYTLSFQTLGKDRWQKDVKYHLTTQQFRKETTELAGAACQVTITKSFISKLYLSRTLKSQMQQAF